MPIRTGFPSLRRYLMICTALPLIMAAGGCSAGGSGLPPAAARPAPAPLGAAYDPGGNAEFTRNDGVDIINAEAAYLRGATGAGTTVAVIDTGFDADHPDLANNISAASYNVVSNNNDIEGDEDHGTKVAGVIAAERNDLGTHGVAYDASILAVKAARCSDIGCRFYVSDLANAVNYATDNMAHVINMSLGGPSGGDGDLNAAIARAANAGTYVVVATGNAGQAEPYYPANLAANPSLDGMVVAVAAATDSGSITAFSNDCGAAMNSCLVAPGVHIATTSDGATDATQTITASGTSFAAPHVSGALALLVQLYADAWAADPRSIALFMFDGARDLGDAGVDAVYGHGLLDVAGAIDVADTAIAGAAIPLLSGGEASLSESSLVLSQAFGDTLGSLSLLNSAIAIIQLSDGAHPYRARLGDRVSRAAPVSALEALLADSGIRTIGLPLGDALSLSMALSGGDTMGAARDDLFDDAPDTGVQALHLAGSVGDATTLRLGLGVAAQDRPGARAIDPAAASLFRSGGAAIDPLAPLAGRGNRVSLDTSLGGATTLALGLFEGETTDLLAGGAGGSAATLGQATLTRAFDSGGAVQLEAGVLSESAALLGSQGAGALTTGAGASTRYATLSGGLPLGPGLELLGTVTLASTEMAGSTTGILGGWDTVRSNAFGIGAVARDVPGDGDRIGLLIGQPLRVYDAAALLVVPVALDGDGGAVLQGDRVDLAPAGREVDFELAFDRKIAPGMGVSSRLLLQLEPGHVAGAGPTIMAGVRLNLKF